MAAAEGRSRIEFGNNIIQEQAVWQIFETIVSKKRPKDELLSERNHSDVRELEILWDKCTAPSLVVSLAAARVLVELVSRNIAEFNYVMNSFLNRITSASHLPGPIHGITKLLCLQRNSFPGLYSLSSNPHPYISILANSPEMWSVLFQEIESVFENKDQRSSLKSILSIFEPFFKHILLNPKTDHAMSRALHSFLLNVASDMQIIADQDALDSILNLVTNHLSLYKKTVTSLGHHVSLCRTTLQWILRKHEGLFEKHTKRLTILLLEMCHEQLSVEHSVLSSLLLLNKITKMKPWILITDGTMFPISQLLLTCSQTYHDQLVEIAFNVSNYIITSSPSHRNKLCFLVLPLLQILATSNNTMLDRKAIQSLSVQLMSNVEKSLKEEHPVDTCQEESSTELFSLPGNWLRRMSMCENVFQFVQSRKDPALIKWLEGMESSLSDSNIDNKDLSWISLLLSAFLIKSSENAAVHVLNVITTLCKVDPTQAPYFLPLLLFKIERSFSSDLKLQILYTIPKLATHKYCVKNVLGTLLVLNNTAELKAVSLRLMFKLWKRQPRVFTKLLKLIEEKSLSLRRDALVELQWTRAVTIRDICWERPTQHGEDLVCFINEIINENVHLKSKENIVLVCLVLEALQALVSAEVIDILSAWEIFGSKLEHSHHLLVLRNLCDFVSVVSSVAVDSQKYQEFKEHVLTFLWRNALHENASVVRSAFSGLAKFDISDFLLRNLPNKLRQPIIERLKSTPKIKQMLKQAEEQEEEIDFDSFQIPGYFYVELLQRTNIPGNPAFEEFLQNVVQHEVAGLPRGLAQTTRKQEKTLESKTMASIPVLMKTRYDNCKQPFLKPSMAASLLFCYELPVQKRMGKAIRSQVLENAKSYRQMLNNLVHEVPVQSSEWHRNVETCHAWTVFMTRVFNANVEGRRAELAMQKERGHISEKELIPGLQNCWLWVRDILTDQLKAASKGSHIMQGNSILALAGLANAIFGYQTSIEPDAKSDVRENEYTPVQEWIASVTDTLLVILDGNLKTIGSPMNWCQQVSSVSSSASSLLARVCAAIALSQVVPTLLHKEFERVKQVIQVLQVRIPGQAKASNSFPIQTHCALGMGLTLKQLYQNNFSDLTGHEAKSSWVYELDNRFLALSGYFVEKLEFDEDNGNMLLVKALDVLETAALSSELENTEGVIYGLGLAMTSLCKETATAVISMHVKSTYNKMIKFYERSKESAKLQALSLAVAYTTVSFYDAGLLDEQCVLKTTLDMENVVESFSQDRDLASAFGLLVHALKISGLNSAEALFNKWTKHWESVVYNKSLSSGAWVASLFGLSALFGSEQTFFMNENSPALSKSYLENGVKLLKQLLQSSAGNLKLIGNISWLLGRLWLASRSSLNSQSAVPDNLNYVGEDSVLNSLVDLLIKLGGKDIPESTETIEIINTTFRILTEGPKDPLPPVNWMNILFPLLKKDFGNKTVRLCLDFALRSTSAKATGTFLSSWLSPSVIINLENDCKILLYSSLEQLVSVLSTKRSKEFLQHVIKCFSNKEVDVTLVDALLNGLHSVLTMTDPPKSLVPCIREAVENVYRLLPNDLKSTHQILISKLAACLQYFPFGDVELLIKSAKENLTKTLALTKQLVIIDAQLFSKLVKPLVDQAISASDVFKVLPSVVSTISCMKLKNSDGFIVEWITELLSRFGSANNFSEERDSILVVLTVLLLVSDTTNDVASTILVLKQQDTFFTEVFPEKCDIQHGWFSTIINLLPVALPRFLQEPNWKPVVEKVITKLLFLHNSSRKLEDSRIVLETLLELRSFEIYEERSIWTKVVSRMSTTCGTNELPSS